MSSTLASFVPVLDGTNYQQWAAQMQSFLMAQGQWAITRNGVPPKAAPKATSSTSKAAATEEEAETVSEDDLEKNSKALGNIRLRLAYNIGYQYNEVEEAKVLWDALSLKYGKPGLSKAFVEFKGAINTTIPNNADPSIALDKMLTHFIRLKQIGFEIPDKVQVMMILAKAPPSFEVTVQALCMESDKLDTLKPDLLVKGLLQSWETHSRSGGKNNQQQANKLSAVKQSNGPPQFQQQQNQQRGNEGQHGQGKRRTRRGKRGGVNQQAAPVRGLLQPLLGCASHDQRYPSG